MDFVGGKETCYDDNGHGAHVCGILSAADIGMAPGAGLYVFKVHELNPLSAPCQDNQAP